MKWYSGSINSLHQRYSISFPMHCVYICTYCMVLYSAACTCKCYILYVDSEKEILSYLMHMYSQNQPTHTCTLIFALFVCILHATCMHMYMYMIIMVGIIECSDSHTISQCMILFPFSLNWPIMQPLYSCLCLSLLPSFLICIPFLLLSIPSHVL